MLRRKSMKKMIAIASAAALLICLSACGSRTAQPETTTEAETTETTTFASVEDDLAMPDVYEGDATTEPIAAQPIAPAIPADVPPATQPSAPETPATEAPAREAPADTTAPTSAPPTTAPPATDTTTQLAKTSPELLNSSVLAPINSGNYTITVTSFTDKNKSADDKLVQSSKGSDKAYRVAVPSANLDYRVFSDNGKYYLADGSKYTELTKEQYDSLSNAMKSSFVQFNNLDYQGTDEQREGLAKYTREHYKAGSADVTLWFRNKSLDRVEVKAGDMQESLPTTVSGSADENLFKLSDSMTQATYEDLKWYAEYTNLIFGTQS